MQFSRLCNAVDKVPIEIYWNTCVIYHHYHGHCFDMTLGVAAVLSNDTNRMPVTGLICLVCLLHVFYME